MNCLKKIISLLTVGALSLSFTSYSQQKQKLAVLDPSVTGEKLTDGLAISVREIVSGCFVNNADSYAIVERSLIDKVMKEAKFSNSDAVDESQATQLGKLAGADKVVLTVISRFENRCMMSIKMIDVESATVDRQISKLVDYNSLLDVTEPLTLALLGKGDADINVNNGSNNSAKNASGSKSGVIAKLSGKKSGSTVNSSSANATKGNYSVDFNGSGVTFQPQGYDVGYMRDEFLADDLGPVYDNSRFNVVIDFSDALVLGQNLYDYVERAQRGDFQSIVSESDRFVREMAKSKEKSFGYMPEAPITLVVKIREVSDDGKINTSDYVFVYSETKEPIAGIRIESKGGRFGSFGNLLGDALEEDAAPKLKGKLSGALKKYKKLHR